MSKVENGGCSKDVILPRRTTIEDVGTFAIPPGIREQRWRVSAKRPPHRRKMREGREAPVKTGKQRTRGARSAQKTRVGGFVSILKMLSCMGEGGEIVKNLGQYKLRTGLHISLCIGHEHPCVHMNREQRTGSGLRQRDLADDHRAGASRLHGGRLRPPECAMGETREINEQLPE